MNASQYILQVNLFKKVQGKLNEEEVVFLKKCTVRKNAGRILVKIFITFLHFINVDDRQEDYHK